MLKLSKKQREQVKEIQHEVAVRVIMAVQDTLQESEEMEWIDELSDEDFTELQTMVIMDTISNLII